MANAFRGGMNRIPAGAGKAIYALVGVAGIGYGVKESIFTGE